jgi:hypothetical protein
MKSLAALFVTVALVVPAFAQEAALNGMQMHRKIPTTAPAFKPIILHTGKPITQNDKVQLISNATKTYTAKMPAAKNHMSGSVAASFLTPSATITPQQLFKPGFVETMLKQPDFVDLTTSDIEFSHGMWTGGASHAIAFYITVNANTTYLAIFKVKSSTNDPKFQINSEPTSPNISVSNQNNVQTINGNSGENEFAYVFIPTGSGSVEVDMLSPNANWQFESCEITATPMN